MSCQNFVFHLSFSEAKLSNFFWKVLMTNMKNAKNFVKRKLTVNKVSFHPLDDFCICCLGPSLWLKIGTIRPKPGPNLPWFWHQHFFCWLLCCWVEQQEQLPQHSSTFSCLKITCADPCCNWNCLGIFLAKKSNLQLSLRTLHNRCFLHLKISPSVVLSSSFFCKKTRSSSSRESKAKGFLHHHMTFPFEATTTMQAMALTASLGGPSSCVVFVDVVVHLYSSRANMVHCACLKHSV